MNDTQVTQNQPGGQEMFHDEPKDRMLKFFAYEHLPQALRAISKKFHDLAHDLVLEIPSSPERTKALNELLYAKDWAVRALLP